MKRKFMGRLLAVIILLSMVGINLNADPLEKVAKKMAKKIKDLKDNKIAVLNFPYHNGYISSGSSIVQERLTTYFARNSKIEVIERNLINKILKEMTLEISGVIDEKTTKELGKVLGVTGLVTGTLNDISSKKTEVNARIIHTQTGKILAASIVKIKRTWLDSPVKPTDYKPEDTEKTEDFKGEPLIQLVIQLDTSGSMSGLINQARAQLWQIINELASSKREGDNPTIQVALYEYGNSNLSSEENYIKNILPFSEDLDMVSSKLFSLAISGGKEYCGAVIMDAVNNLKWDKYTDVYKVIFIAGNEPFTQGPVDFRTAISEAVKKDIFVNTIFCGNNQQGIATKWKAGADLGNGEYFSIVQEAKVVSIQSPQDTEIKQLGNQLNQTFIFYGSRGKESKKLQKEQDKRARALPGVSVERSLFKVKAQYSRSIYGDLVSDIIEGKVKMGDIKKEDIPPELQEKSDEEILEYINKKSRQREEIQGKMKKLNDERRVYIREKQKEMVGGPEQTLGQAMLNAVRNQAVKKNFKFED